ncbi:TetR/AcrR family transcriptional regulator [Aliivibrio fischeri]|uniref:TetR/AcrR family transcriptional regulator n=1 Tax=Aliivibrio fischeri TaxID=668 RepID=UPI0012D9E239|nr:TetR/AcrR family transcriptional regulator [Aliivibrio fischeri]MUI53689.1 TetR family transcriptional regulator [Aliivibrio fischeri]MUJ38780.1 TetR family transcriptional regulator [Aliivibrio fischeri]
MSVKEKKRGRPSGSNKQLSQKSIMIMAKELMKSEGKIPSIRKLATHLDVDAMAIYYYFSNKNALLEAITVSLIEEIHQPNEQTDWQDELHLLCVSYLRLLNTYTGLLETLLSMTSQGPADIFTERFSMIIEPLELDNRAKKNALDLLADYLHGFALALHCNPSHELDISEYIKGPLNFYCLALKHSH